MGFEPIPSRWHREILPVEPSPQAKAGGGSRTHARPFTRRLLYRLSYTSIGQGGGSRTPGPASQTPDVSVTPHPEKFS